MMQAIVWQRYGRRDGRLGPLRWGAGHCKGAACRGYTYNSVQGNEWYFPYPVVFGSSMSISKYSSFGENWDDKLLDTYGKTWIQVEKR